MNIAVDGPAGSGKSTLCKALAGELGYIYVDTGALYRAVALGALRGGISLQNEGAVAALLGSLTLTLAYEQGVQNVYLNGENVSAEIRTPEVSAGASAVARYKAVREFLLKTQRELAQKNNVIMDGRDIGTVILPNAEVKIFLTASAEIRAKRRFDELRAKGDDISFEEVLSQVIARDEQDSNRAEAPLTIAPGAIVLDTSELDFDGALAALRAIVLAASEE